MSSESPAISFLKTDLAAFAEAGSTVDVSPTGEGWYQATWSQAGRDRTAQFLLQDPNAAVPTAVKLSDSEEVPYRTFLSGADMGDLRSMARAIGHVVPPVEPYVPLLTESLDSPVDLDASDRTADSLISELAVPGDGRTELVFVSAEPGTGKTSLLRNLVRQKATDYLEGGSNALWLYVDAQGRRLAQLDEAIAAEFDDLRARIPYHTASALVRSGAMILVVDGFDELIGSVGSYDEAFSSLTDFIAGLNGEGCLVAAARSSYYEQEFLTRTTTSLRAAADTWTLHGVRLAEWDSGSRTQYLDLYAEAKGFSESRSATFIEGVLNALATPDVVRLSHKPLFVGAVADILSEGDDLNGDGSLLDRLIGAYIHREVSQKMLGGRDRPLLSYQQYEILLEEIAFEMWRQETRELARSSVRDIGRDVGEVLEIPSDALDEVVQRLPNAALLAQGSSTGSVVFEHDLYYCYFLARPVSQLWGRLDGFALGRVLKRGRLPEDAAELAARRVNGENVQSLIDTLANSVDVVHGSQVQMRRNIGNLAAAILRQTDGQGLRFEGFIFGDTPLQGVTLEGAEFVKCLFAGTDFSDCKLRRCSADSCSFDRPVIEVESTVLDIDGADVRDFFGLRVRDGNATYWAFSPPEIRHALDRCGLPAASNEVAPTRPVADEAVALLDRLCRVFLRTNSITETDDNELGSIVKDTYWPAVRDAMLHSGVMVTQLKSASGRKVFLKRTVRAQDILAGLDPEADVPKAVELMWTELATSCPST